MWWGECVSGDLAGFESFFFFIFSHWAGERGNGYRVYEAYDTFAYVPEL